MENSRTVFDHVLTTQASRDAAKAGEVIAAQAERAIPLELRNQIHGDDIALGLGQSIEGKYISKFIDSAMNFLATKPTDRLVRHPYASTVYRQTLRHYLSSVESDALTPEVLEAAEATARGEATRQVRNLLYNMADERQISHMLRFVSPFFQAQVEVLEKYAHLAMEKPETMARLAQLYVGSQTMPNPFFKVVDQDGNPAKGYSPDNRVVFQNFGPLKKLFPYASSFTIPTSSLDVITQGQNPFIPSTGPLVTAPLSEFHYRERPELSNSAIYRWLYPYGQPQGSNFLERAASSVEPAWARRLTTSETENLDDAAFARRAAQIRVQMQVDWENGGRVGPEPTDEKALEATKNEYRLRAASSLLLPTPVTPQSPYQPLIDAYRQYEKKYGEAASEKFYDDFGPDALLFAGDATHSVGGMAPTVAAKTMYDRYHGLIEQAPSMVGVLTGSIGSNDPDFSQAVYDWQMRTRVSPLSSDTLRERQSPSEQMNSAYVNRGWVQYNKLQDTVTSALRTVAAQGGSSSLSASSNAVVRAWRNKQLQAIMASNPGWEAAYTSASSNLESVLQDAYHVAFDPQLDSRADITGLRSYLIARAQVSAVLDQRAAVGGSHTLTYTPDGAPTGQNADVGTVWQNYTSEMVAKNPAFAPIYNRYFEHDDLSVVIPAAR
ncbi:hypothetical protein P5P86_16775 [Nocardioides sp. BP30]|uniref:hypothetical protein n=1 Tax=Nocardioides sp. BP30 TaxID=3036374 RepID=UPI002469ADB5|nr:hypothetical protein [Nocardioides sp. BP30]WGL51604.1 hypothetical protein P5P86_16775 [Nocardioides sp. BP30]